MLGPATKRCADSWHGRRYSPRRPLRGSRAVGRTAKRAFHRHMMTSTCPADAWRAHAHGGAAAGCMQSQGSRARCGGRRRRLLSHESCVSFSHGPPVGRMVSGVGRGLWVLAGGATAYTVEGRASWLHGALCAPSMAIARIRDLRASTRASRHGSCRGAGFGLRIASLHPVCCIIRRYSRATGSHGALRAETREGFCGLAV